MHEIALPSRSRFSTAAPLVPAPASARPSFQCLLARSRTRRVVTCVKIVGSMTTCRKSKNCSVVAMLPKNTLPAGFESA